MTRMTNVPAGSLRRWEPSCVANVTVIGLLVVLEWLQVAPGGLPTEVLTTVKFAGIEMVTHSMLVPCGSRVTVTLVATPAVSVIGAAATVHCVSPSAGVPDASEPALPITANARAARAGRL